MSRRRVQPLNITDTITNYATTAMRQVTDDISQVTRKYQQNELVLRRLAEAGLIDPERYNYQNIRSYEYVEFDNTLSDKKRTKLLGALHGCVGTVKEDGKELVDGKKRIIKVSLKLAEYPESTIYISYLRRYPKSEEANCPCKIVEVVAQEAKPAQPEKKVLALVCQTP